MVQHLFSLPTFITPTWQYNTTTLRHLLTRQQNKSGVQRMISLQPGIMSNYTKKKSNWFGKLMLQAKFLVVPSMYIASYQSLKYGKQVFVLWAKYLISLLQSLL